MRADEEIAVTDSTTVKIVHLIIDLDIGGAEMMLLKLAGAMRRSQFENVIVSMVDQGALLPRFQELGVPVYSLGMRYGQPSLAGLSRLTRLLQHTRPHILQTWMYHANLLGLLAKRGKSPALVWNIRASTVELARYSRATRFNVWLGARLSGLPDKIVINSEAGARDHAGMGYRSQRMEVIPNGFDLERFRPDPQARRAIRQELGLDESRLMVGLVARYDPMKDHETFLRAAGLLVAQFPSAVFVMAGGGVVPNNPELAGLIAALKLQDQVVLLGERDDVPRLMQAMDIVALSSVSEGFPNVIGEAMACGVPVVATDAGDSRRVVGDTGTIVPTRDPQALADGLAGILRMPRGERQQLGQRARDRIASEFSIERVAARYEALYQSLADGFKAIPER